MKNNNAEKIKVCYIPGRESSYARNRVLISAMRKAGLEVYDCSSPERSFFRYFSSFFKFLSCKGRCDIVFVGFMGHFLVPLIRLFTRKKIIFDVFVSVYETMVFERKTFREDSVFAGLARYVDRMSCRMAEKVIIDTEDHIEYFVREFGIEKEKFAAVPAGADDTVMIPQGETEREGFTVHFHGEFQELHGTKYIIEAASRLPGLKFQMIGKGKGFYDSRKTAIEKGISNINFIEGVNYEDLPMYMSRADICLGIFGSTPKANMVIPNKVYEALAVKKAVITADTPAARSVLSDGENAVLCKSADPDSLVEAIRSLKDNIEFRRKIEEGGYALFKERFSPEAIGQILQGTIEDAM